MALDVVPLNPGTGGANVSVDKINGVSVQVVKVAHGAEGTSTPVDATHGLPVIDAAAEASLDAIEAAVTGTLTTKTAGASTSTTTVKTAQLTSQTIFASNAAARGRKLWNDDPSSTLYLFDGSTAASTSNWSQKVGPGGYYEYPAPLYVGQVTGIWDGTPSGSGVARVTEVA